jgi:hypothetical protein
MIDQKKKLKNKLNYLQLQIDSSMLKMSANMRKSDNSSSLLVDDDTAPTRQFVHDIMDFSSQYGKEASKSYTVYNVKSFPNHYPKYGDFLESCVLVSI